MKTVALRRIVLFFGMCFVLGLALLPVQAQGQNLLTNPGFEKPFVTLDGNPPRQVAQRWSPWNLAGGQTESENVQPEYYPASDTSNGLGVPRIRSGSDAQQYQTFFGTHDGGLFQRVTGITAGTQLQFSAYIYVWSTTFDDANKSEQPGGVVVMVGIDPTGGTSGDSANIVWSQPNVQYDAYNQYSVTATASGTAITVFVRTTVSTPVKNNDIYIDDASLTAASASVPTVAPTATKTNVPPPSPTNTVAPTATKSVPTATSTSGDLGIFTNTPAPTQTPLPSATPPPAPTSTRPPTVTPTFTLVPPTPAPTTVPPTEPPTQEVQVPTNTPVIVTATFAPTPAPTLIAGEFSGKVVHNVQPNDTVGQLATLYGSTADAIIQANGLNSSALIRVGQTLVIPVKLAAPATSTPTITPLVPPPTPTPTTTAYTVQAGDTLNRIAARFNTTATTLAQLNGIANPNIIHVGQHLVIPVGGQVVVPATAIPVGSSPTTAPSDQPKTYVVRPGDTLFRIALRNGVTLHNLIQANGIRDQNLVFVGQVLVIP